MQTWTEAVGSAVMTGSCMIIASTIAAMDKSSQRARANKTKTSFVSLNFNGRISIFIVFGLF